MDWGFSCVCSHTLHKISWRSWATDDSLIFTEWSSAIVNWKVWKGDRMAELCHSVSVQLTEMAQFHCFCSKSKDIFNFRTMLRVNFNLDFIVVRILLILVRSANNNNYNWGGSLWQLSPHSFAHYCSTCGTKQILFQLYYRLLTSLGNLNYSCFNF